MEKLASRYMEWKPFVKAFEPGLGIEKLPPEIRRDLQAVWAALEYIAAARYDQARQEIQPIGMRSLFSHWKWFIKGLGYFYEQQDSDAVRAFEKIGADSVPGRAALPYLKLLQESPWCEPETKNSALMEKVAIVAGYGAESLALARAEYLWQVNRLRDSLTHLLHSLDDFPTWRPGLMGTLTQLYFNICFHLPPENAFKYVEHLKRSVRQGRHAGDSLWFQRTAALFFEMVPAHDEDFFNRGLLDQDILDLRKDFLNSFGQIADGNRQLARGLVFKRLGDIFAEEAQQDDPFAFPFFKTRARGPELRNPALAEECYLESARATPDALSPQLALADLYEKTGDDSALNRLLDRLIKQFPDEKDVLAKAGVRCTQRNAFVKAMKYLERAMILDPMDHMLREAFIVTAIQAALQYSRKGNGAKARVLLPRALEKEQDTDKSPWKKNLTERFGQWLDQLDGEPAAAAQPQEPTPDLYGFYEALCLLGSDVRKDTRRNHETFVRFSETLEGFEGMLHVLTERQGQMREQSGRLAHHEQKSFMTPYAQMLERLLLEHFAAATGWYQTLLRFQ